MSIFAWQLGKDVSISFLSPHDRSNEAMGRWQSCRQWMMWSLTCHPLNRSIGEILSVSFSPWALPPTLSPSNSSPLLSLIREGRKNRAETRDGWRGEVGSRHTETVSAAWQLIDGHCRLFIRQLFSTEARLSIDQTGGWLQTPANTLLGFCCILMHWPWQLRGARHNVYSE